VDFGLGLRDRSRGRRRVTSGTATHGQDDERQAARRPQDRRLRTGQRGIPLGAGSGSAHTPVQG
jgi:hypothetical protein